MELVFALVYSQHGGSGLGFTWSDVMCLELRDLLWFGERLGEQREREAREIEKAAGHGRRR